MMSTLRRSTAATAVLLLAASLTACGKDDKADDDGDRFESPAALSRSEVGKALLTLDNVGPGFSVAPEDDDDDDDDTSLGCFTDIAKNDDKGPFTDSAKKDDSVEAEIEFEYNTQLKTPGVFNNISSSPSWNGKDVFKPVADKLEDCTEVHETDKDGTTYDLTIDTDSDTTLDDVDEQLNITADGNVSSKGFKLPVTFDFVFYRVDNHAGWVGTVEFGDSGIDADEYAEISLHRLQAVIDGKEPETEVAATPNVK